MHFLFHCSPNPVYDEFEEGGYRQSGLGRLNGVAALDDFVEYKHISLTTGAA
ncbi:TPA: hypothetical protein NID00_003104 [Pseudomonas aeruginosa]|nr:hypothetical protein [Pseudomonas aeruginosa]